MLMDRLAKELVRIAEDIASVEDSTENELYEKVKNIFPGPFVNGIHSSDNLELYYALEDGLKKVCDKVKEYGAGRSLHNVFFEYLVTYHRKRFRVEFTFNDDDYELRNIKVSSYKPS